MNHDKLELRGIINTGICWKTFNDGQEYTALDGKFHIILFYETEENEKSARRTLLELYGPIQPCSIGEPELMNLLSEPQLQEVYSHLKEASLVHLSADIDGGQKRNQWISFPASYSATAEFTY